MNMKAMQAVTGLAVVLAVSGCATVSVQKERLEKVKTVAIIGFTGQVAIQDSNKATGGIGGAINGIKGAVEVSSGEYRQRREQQAREVYGHLVDRLQQTMGWTVVDKDKVANNSSYLTLAQANPSGGVGSGYGEQVVPGLVREESLRTLDNASLTQLAKALGVDAVAVVRVKYVVGDKSGVSIGGVGHTTLYPKAIVQFALYDAEGQDPAWKDKWAEGAPTKDGISNTMGVESDANESQVLVAAADSAVGALIDRVQAHR
jgi:hypothetical protein